MFTGENPEVSHLNIFGCHVYLHVPKEKRSKLDLQERREYLLDTVNSQNLIETIFQDSIKSRSVEMLHFMKM